MIHHAVACCIISSLSESDVRCLIVRQAVRNYPKYCAAVPCTALDAQTRILLSDPCTTGSQRRQFKICSVRSHSREQVTSRATELCTFCRCSISVLGKPERCCHSLVEMLPRHVPVSCKHILRNILPDMTNIVNMTVTVVEHCFYLSLSMVRNVYILHRSCYKDGLLSKLKLDYDT